MKRSPYPIDEAEAFAACFKVRNGKLVFRSAVTAEIAIKRLNSLKASIEQDRQEEQSKCKSNSLVEAVKRFRKRVCRK